MLETFTLHEPGPGPGKARPGAVLRQCMRVRQVISPTLGFWSRGHVELPIHIIHQVIEKSYICRHSYGLYDSSARPEPAGLKQHLNEEDQRRERTREERTYKRTTTNTKSELRRKKREENREKRQETREVRGERREERGQRREKTWKRRGEKRWQRTEKKEKREERYIWSHLGGVWPHRHSGDTQGAPRKAPSRRTGVSQRHPGVTPPARGNLEAKYAESYMFYQHKCCERPLFHRLERPDPYQLHTLPKKSLWKQSSQNWWPDREFRRYVARTPSAEARWGKHVIW